MVTRNKPSTDLPASPAKGILLTPGAAANKRKTVSFGSLASEGDIKSDLFMGQVAASAETAAQTPSTSNLPRGHECHSPMSKSAFESQLEDSKRRIQRQISTGELTPSTIQSRPGLKTGLNQEGHTIVTNPEFTVDLDVPRSRSGKHWKGEYDLYHKKTNREMRRVIQHGQTMKLYAQKKDMEATDLRQKLKTELAKVESMEAKVSDLATKLAKSRVKGDDGNIDSGNLVHDLAKQTASAIRHRKIVEKYEEALEEAGIDKTQQIDEDDCVCIEMERSSDSLGTKAGLSIRPRELSDLHAELKRFQSATMIAEDKAIRLDKENMELKQKLARIKTEMQKYESRRLAREERLKKREAKLIAARENSDARRAQLESMHKNLLQAQQSGSGNWRAMRSSGGRKGVDIGERDVEPDMLSAGATRNEGPYQIHPPRPLEERNVTGTFWNESSSPKERKSGSPVIRVRSPLVHLDNINAQGGRNEMDQAKDCFHSAAPATQEPPTNEWAHDIRGELIDDTLSYTEAPNDSDFNRLRRSTHAALQELSQTSIDDHSTCARTMPQLAKTAEESSAPDHPPHRAVQLGRGTIASPRPSLLSFGPNNSDRALQRSRPVSNITRQSSRSSLISTGREITTLGSRRALPSHRAEAAKQRLEAKKEGKRLKESMILKG